MLAVTTALLFISSSLQTSFAQSSSQGNSGLSWNQYHGDYTHNGASTSEGPVTPFVVWSTNVGTAYAEGITSVNGHLILASENGVNHNFLVLSEDNGSQLEQLHGDIIGTAYPVTDGSLVWSGGVIGNTATEVLYATSLADGSFKWRSPIQGDLNTYSSYFGSYLMSYYAGDVFIVGYDSSYLYSFVGSSGSPLWSIQSSGIIDTIPTIGNGIMTVGFSNLHVLSAFATSTGQSEWNYSVDSIVDAPPAFDSGYFYFGTEGGTCYEVSSNGAGGWSTDLGAGIETTPSAFGGEVFVATTAGVIYALNASTGMVVWQFTAAGSVASSPVVSANGLVYDADTTGELYALNATTGSLVWQYNLGAAPTSSPVIDSNRLFVMNQEGTIFAFGTAYPITIQETGLPVGTKWTAKVGNTTMSSSNSTIHFLELNGNYQYEIPLVLGYSANPPNGSFSVMNQATTINVTFSPGWTLPSAPQNLTASASIGSILLTWKPPRDSGAPLGFSGLGLLEYEIFRGSSPGQEEIYDQVNASQTAYTDNSVTANSIYFYTVVAVNPVGSSGFSNEVSAQPQFETVPSAVQDFTATPLGDSVQLQWTGPASNGGSPVNEYVVLRGPSSNQLSVLATLPANSSSYTDRTNLLGGQTYYYAVEAVNSQGTGATSGSIPVVAPTTPSTTGFGVIISAFTDPTSNNFFQAWALAITSALAIVFGYLTLRGARRQAKDERKIKKAEGKEKALEKKEKKLEGEVKKKEDEQDE